MASKVNVSPPSLKEAKTYESYKKELKMWSAVTDVPKEKQGNLIALSLPNESKFGNNIKERVLERLSVSELGKENALPTFAGDLDNQSATGFFLPARYRTSEVKFVIPIS